MYVVVFSISESVSFLTIQTLWLNNSSMLLESSCSEVENRKDEIDLPRGKFHFPRSGQSDRGWTVQIEENVSFLKANQLSLRDSPLQSTTFKQHGFIFYAF